MKRIITVVVAIGIIGVFIAVLLRQREITAPRSTALNPPKATGSLATGPASTAASSQAEISSVNRASPASIPLIDRNNPAYATMVRALDGGYWSMLQYYIPNESRKVAELEAAVRLLTTVRLSQMMHEATLATVIKSSAQSVTIAIPAYEAEGQSLQRYLEDNLHLSFKISDLKRVLTNDFNHFGRYRQEIEVSPNGQFRSETLYQIGHTTYNGLWTQSNLPSSLLGAYGVFEPLFPKP